jgi:ornithine cyclodeaminase/alanine dehydrogenase-like protein (mu-crystallin family)
MEHEEAIRELRDFAETTAAVLANHREQLQRHEEILHAQYKGGESHHAAITELRELVSAQSQLLTSMQRVMLRIVKSLGFDPDETNPDSVN